MENNIEILENIMKPYFDKKEQLEKNNSNTEINVLKLRLEKLNENKESEIEAYLNEVLGVNSNFGYRAMVRKDLELAYKEKEDQLKKEISELENSVSFKRVDLREMVEIKQSLRQQLYAEQKRLNFDLKREQINFDSIMLELSSFKYEYNEQNQVINGAAWRELYEKSNEIVDKMNNIRATLKKIEEYFNLTELTKEEGTAIMRSMTPWEKEEYDRRKGILQNIEEPEKIENPEESEVSEKIEEPEQTDDISNDIIEINDPVIAESKIEEDNIIVEDMSNLLKSVYNDIVSEAKNLRSIKLNPSKDKLFKSEYYVSSKSNDEDYELAGTVNLVEEEPIKLPNGEYVNADDINKALDDLYNKNKGKSYVVREINKMYKISKRTIAKLKNKLKDCSTIKLVKDKKISKLDLFRVFGKEKANEKEQMSKEAEIGTLENINIPEGDYISRNELIMALDNLFTTKKLDWLRKLSDKLKTKKNKDKSELEPVEGVELDEDFRMRTR